MQTDSRVLLDHAVRHNREITFQEIPFTICLLANLSGLKNSTEQARRASNRRFISVVPGNLSRVLGSMRPTLRFLFNEQACAGETFGPRPCEEFVIDFQTLEDFEPQRISTLLSQRYAVGNNIGDGLGASDATEKDNRLQQRLDEILRDSSFKRLHTAWLGVDLLLKTARTPSIVVLLFDVTKDELLSSSLSDPRSAVNRAVHELTHTPGSHPPVALLADFEFGPRDIRSLSALARLAENVPTALIAAASPIFLPRDNYANLNMVEGTAMAHRDAELFAEWRQFRREEFAKHVFLVLPPVLFRLRYSNVAIPPTRREEDVWTYSEKVGDCLWGNGIFAVGCLLMLSFRRYGWVAALSPLESAGMSLEFPIQPSDEKTPAPIGPTAVSVFSQSCSSLAKLGFLTICECKGSPFVAVFEDVSCSIDDHPSARLISLLACFRLGRALLLYARHIDVASLPDSAVIKNLQNWLSKYSSQGRDANDRHRYPIQSSGVSITSDDTMRHILIKAFIKVNSSGSAEAEYEITTLLSSELKAPPETTVNLRIHLGRGTRGPASNRRS